MKKILLFTLAFLLSPAVGILLAQSPYSGGQGDGYDSDKFSSQTHVASPGDWLEVKLYPNPVQSGKSVTIRLEKPQNHIPVMISINNIIGKKLFIQQFLGQNIFEIDLPKAKFPAGIYIVQIKQGDEIKTLRMNIFG